METMYTCFATKTLILKSSIENPEKFPDNKIHTETIVFLDKNFTN